MAIATATALALAGLASSTVGGALANRKQKITSSSNSSTRRTLPPELEPLQGEIISAIRSRISNPGEGVEPLRLNARNQVNRNYDALPDVLRDRFLSSGGGRSGKFGAGVRAGEVSRIQGLSDLEGQFSKFILDRGDEGLSLGERLLALSQGQESKSAGEQVIPGNMLGGAVASGGSALSSLSTLMTLDKLLRGAGKLGAV